MIRAALFAALPLAFLFTDAAMAQSSVAGARASDLVDAARSRIESFAREMDADGDGLIAMPEFEAMGDTIFASMDVDESGTLTQAEFTRWEFGLSEMAEFRGRAQAFDAAMGLVFDLYDRGDDGTIDGAEFDEAQASSVAYADADGDGALSYREFRAGFIIAVALRHAMVAD